MDDFLSFYKIFKIINIHLNEFIKEKSTFLKIFLQKLLYYDFHGK